MHAREQGDDAFLVRNSSPLHGRTGTMHGSGVIIPRLIQFQLGQGSDDKEVGGGSGSGRKQLMWRDTWRDVWRTLPAGEREE